MFARGSAAYDWCEPNYFVSSIVAEFWNTVSNIFFFVIPPLVLIQSRSYLQRMPNRIFLLWIFLIFTGIGSCYFHATLSLAGELLDKMCILWILMIAYGIFLPVYFKFPFSTNRPHLFFYLCIVIGIITTIISIIFPATSRFPSMMLLGIPSVIFLFRSILQCDQSRIKSLGFQCLSLWLVAISLWLLDRFFCSFWLSISFPYLHSIWHFLILFSCNEAIVIFAYFITQYQYKNLDIEIRKWPFENQLLIGVSYIKLMGDDDDTLISLSSNTFNDEYEV